MVTREGCDGIARMPLSFMGSRCCIAQAPHAVSIHLKSDEAPAARAAEVPHTCIDEAAQLVVLVRGFGALLRRGARPRRATAWTELVRAIAQARVRHHGATGVDALAMPRRRNTTIVASDPAATSSEMNWLVERTPSMT